MNKIVLLSSLLLLFFFIACQTNNKKTSSFELTSVETLALITAREDLLAPDQAKSLSQESQEQYKLIDLRPEAEFVVGHIDGAINIPTQYLLDPEHTSLWTNEGVVKVLYGNNQLQANGPWLLLRQMGYDQIKVMQGGYSYMSQPVDSAAGPKSYLAEQARYDYSAVFKLSVAETEEALKAQKPKPVPASKPAPKKVAPKKKKQEDDEGGC